MAALPKIVEEFVSGVLWWFSNFSILCVFCRWKSLVCFKTLIYCGQLCNNAVNLPKYPFTEIYLAVESTRVCTYILNCVRRMAIAAN
jgi:hypothetical protein